MKAALWCPATDCLLWLFRLGLNPDTVRVKYGPGLVTPSMMPDPYTNLDDLPNGVEAAAAYVRGDTRPKPAKRTSTATAPTEGSLRIRN